MTDDDLKEIGQHGCLFDTDKQGNLCWSACDELISKLVNEILRLRADNKKQTRTVEEALAECRKWRLTDAEVEDLLK